MKGNLTGSQRFKNISYIDFRAARDAYTKIRKGEIDEIFQKLKDCLAG